MIGTEVSGEFGVGCQCDSADESYAGESKSRALLENSANSLMALDGLSLNLRARNPR